MQTFPAWRLFRLMRQNVCGMSVVGSDYDLLKRYNLAEIYDPTPKEREKQAGTEAEGAGNLAIDGPKTTSG